MVVTEPLRVTNLAEGYDIDATIDGGGVSGQAGALRLGITRARSSSSTPSCAPRSRRPASSPATPARRRARSTASRRRARPRSTPSGSRSWGCGSAPTASAASPTPSWVPSWSWPWAVRRPAPCRRGRFLVGRDTRRSGPLLQAALSAGMASEGADVVDLGVLPTPGVAWLAAAARLPRGGGLGVAQPLRRQRHQALRGRRAEAARRHRGRRRGGARPGPGRRRRASAPARGPRRGAGCRSSPTRADGYVEHLVRLLEGRDLGRPARRGRLRQRRRLGRGARSPRRAWAPRSSPSPTSPTASNINDGCGSTHPERARRRGRGPRRAISASPSTATPIGCWPSTTPARWPPGTSCCRCSPPTWPAGASWPATPSSSRS